MVPSADCRGFSYNFLENRNQIREDLIAIKSEAGSLNSDLFNSLEDLYCYARPSLFFSERNQIEETKEEKEKRTSLTLANCKRLERLCADTERKIAILSKQKLSITKLLGKISEKGHFLLSQVEMSLDKIRSPIKDNEVFDFETNLNEIKSLKTKKDLWTHHREDIRRYRLKAQRKEQILGNRLEYLQQQLVRASAHVDFALPQEEGLGKSDLLTYRRIQSPHISATEKLSSLTIQQNKHMAHSIWRLIAAGIAILLRMKSILYELHDQGEIENPQELVTRIKEEIKTLRERKDVWDKKTREAKGWQTWSQTRKEELLQVSLRTSVPDCLTPHFSP